MTEIPLWVALAFIGVVGGSAFLCAEHLEKLNKKVERQNELLGRIVSMLERRFD